MAKEKKPFEKPELVTYGDLAFITKNVIKPGTGDVLALSQGIPDVLASS